MPPKDTKTFKPISDKLTLKQRLDRPDATLHALCDPNPSATGDDTKSSESIIERFVIRLPGTITEVLLKVPSKRLILPGNFKLSDQQANFDGMDAVGYVRSSEPIANLCPNHWPRKISHPDTPRWSALSLIWMTRESRS